jgi:hypothetical protein
VLYAFGFYLCAAKLHLQSTLCIIIIIIIIIIVIIIITIIITVHEYD